MLLTTFSATLANALRAKLARLVGNEPNVAERIAVQSVGGIADALYAELFGAPRIAAPALVASLLAEAAGAAGGQRFSQTFLTGEWREVVDAWQLRTWEAYRDVARLGRKTRIGGKQREVLWAIFARVREELDRRGLVTGADVFARVAEHYAGGRPARSRSSSSTRRRTWACRRCGSWRRWGGRGRTACSSPATSASGSSRCR